MQKTLRFALPESEAYFARTFFLISAFLADTYIYLYLSSLVLSLFCIVQGFVPGVSPLLILVPLTRSSGQFLGPFSCLGCVRFRHSRVNPCGVFEVDILEAFLADQTSLGIMWLTSACVQMIATSLVILRFGLRLLRKKSLTLGFVTTRLMFATTNTSSQWMRYCSALRTRARFISR